MKLIALFVSAALMSGMLVMVPASSTEVSHASQVARWMAEESTWGTLTIVPSKNRPGGEGKLFGNSSLESVVLASIVPMAASKEYQGRVFFYLMGEHNISEAALTLSQAALDPSLFILSGCGTTKSAVDTQDPRCAKVTFQGSIQKCSTLDCSIIGKETLFQKHPTMAKWPEDHHFLVHELKIESVWMIANFGGARVISPSDYGQAVGHANQISEGTAVNPPVIPGEGKKVPNWNDFAKRARWIVHHSRWTTLSTLHDVSGDKTASPTAFGNIRSVTDGLGTFSTGRPVFYLPNVDPTAQDIVQNGSNIAMTFTEAALAERVTPDGTLCGDNDPGSPLCGQVVLYGKAVPIQSHLYYEHVLQYFAMTHPLAPWLAHGGSHMPGSYYTIQIEKVMLLDYFGGFTQVKVGEYLQSNFGDDDAESNELFIHQKNCPSLSLGWHALSVLLVAVGTWCFTARSRPRQGSSSKTLPYYSHISEGASSSDNMDISEDDDDDGGPARGTPTRDVSLVQATKIGVV